MPIHALCGKKGVPTGRGEMPFLDSQTRPSQAHLALRQAKVKSGEGWRDVRVFSGPFQSAHAIFLLALQTPASLLSGHVNR